MEWMGWWGGERKAGGGEEHTRHCGYVWGSEHCFGKYLFRVGSSCDMGRATRGVGCGRLAPGGGGAVEDGLAAFVFSSPRSIFFKEANKHVFENCSPGV